MVLSLRSTSRASISSVEGNCSQVGWAGGSFSYLF